MLNALKIFYSRLDLVNLLIDNLSKDQTIMKNLSAQ